MKDSSGMRTKIPVRRLIFSALLLLFTVGGWWTYRIERALLRAGRLYDIDWHFLRAVAMQETRMNPKAVGAAGEIGLFQIMPNTAKHWSRETNRPVLNEKQLFNLKNNAEISAWYLRQGINRFSEQEDPLPYALAYYNAGPSRAIRWAEELPEGVPFANYIPFSSTRKYVTNILEIYRGEEEDGQ